MNNTVTSQARIFASEYAANTGREMLDTISGTGRKAGRISKIVLAVSMPHQIAFILGLAPLVWHTLEEILFSATLILGAVLIPIAVDYLILICIQIVAARGMAKKVKIAAMWVMAFPILVSGAVNVFAPAPPTMQALFGVMVLLIPAGEGLRAFIRPDFAAIEQMEQEVAAQVSRPEPEVDEETRTKRQEAGRKAAETKRQNAEREAAVREERRIRRAVARATKAAELAAMVDGDVPANTPVSPAPIEQR